MTAIPFRLEEAHRAWLAAHFLALDREDRRLRFGGPVPDEVVREYVTRVDFERDGLYAVREGGLGIIAAIHVATTDKSAELGLSVLPGHRGRGLGNALFQRAVTFLRNRGVEEIFVHCLAENGAMVHLARKNGMRVVHSGAQSDARLQLEPATADSYVTEWLDDQKSALKPLAAKGP